MIHIHTGNHTMGKARYLSIRRRIYDDNNSKEQFYHHRKGKTYRRILQSICPKSGKDNAFAPLYSMTLARFDNHYFISIIKGCVLLQSDNVLVTKDMEGEIREHVWAYANNQDLFFDSFVGSMIKMGSTNVITEEEGEIRKNCRYVNI